jgi:hypothetical protein
LIWQGFDGGEGENDSLEITLPEGIALSMHLVYVERIAKAYTPTGHVLMGRPADSKPVQAWSLGTDDALVTTAHRIDVFRTSEGGELLLLAQATEDEQGQPLELYGRFTDQIAYSNDGTLAFIAGTNSNIYVFDTQTQRVVHTLEVVNSTTGLTSLAVIDGWLYAAEGNALGETGGRLVRIDVDPLSQGFLRTQQVVNFGADLPYGILDMAANNGSYLALTAPQSRVSIAEGGETRSGNVYVLDVGKIGDDGSLSAITTIDAGGFPVPGRGKAPHYLTSGQGDAEFLLSSARDENGGLVGLALGLDRNGNLSGGVSAQRLDLTPRASDPGWLKKKFQQNIQRASDTVIVEYAGVEFALVADYNFNFNDPHWGNDEILGKQIGGKIGIVADPFGGNGGPYYLGATTPIVGGAVEHLSLFVDQQGNGKLYADVFIYDDTASGADRTIRRSRWFAIRLDVRHRYLYGSGPGGPAAASGGNPCTAERAGQRIGYGEFSHRRQLPDVLLRHLRQRS